MGLSSSKFDPSKDLLDLTGKVALVTGGNRGIGYWNVLHLRKLGAKVYLCARSEAKALAAIEAMDAEPSLANVDNKGEAVFLQMDLSDPKGVRDAALKVMENETRLDIIVNNAAVSLVDWDKTEAAMFKPMLINYISHFVLVNTLSPLLEQTAREEGSDVRVATLYSDAYARTFLAKFDSFEPLISPSPETITFRGYITAYGQSKLANGFMSKELQRRYDARGIPITCLAVHPALVATDSSVGSYNVMFPAFITRLFFRLLSWGAEEGSFNTLFAAASFKVKEDRKKYQGAYLVPIGKLTATKALTNDPAIAKVLWETTEKFLTSKYEL